MIQEAMTRGPQRSGKEGCLCGGRMGTLTLGLQLLLLLPSPRVVVILRQLFCHGLGVDVGS